MQYNFRGSQYMRKLHTVFDKLYPGNPVILYRGSVILAVMHIHAAVADSPASLAGMQGFCLKAVLIHPPPDLFHLRTGINIIAVPLVTPMHVGKPCRRNPADAFLNLFNFYVFRFVIRVDSKFHVVLLFTFLFFECI